MCMFLNRDGKPEEATWKLHIEPDGTKLSGRQAAARFITVSWNLKSVNEKNKSAVRAPIEATLSFTFFFPALWSSISEFKSHKWHTFI